MKIRKIIELVYRQGRQESYLEFNIIDDPISDKEKKFLDTATADIIGKIEEMMITSKDKSGWFIHKNNWQQFKCENGVEK